MMSCFVKNPLVFLLLVSLLLLQAGVRSVYGENTSQGHELPSETTSEDLSSENTAGNNAKVYFDTIDEEPPDEWDVDVN